MTLFGRNGCVNLQNIILNSHSLVHSIFKCFFVPEIDKALGTYIMFSGLMVFIYPTVTEYLL